MGGTNLMSGMPHVGMRLRWAVITQGWQPSAAEWSQCLLLLPPSDQQDVMQIQHAECRKLRLVSRLLQRYAVHTATGAKPDCITIHRAAGAKPHLVLPDSNSDSDGTCHQLAQTFTFSTAGMGHAVVLASESARLCGVDVVGPAHLRAGPRLNAQQLCESLRDCFTTAELVWIEAQEGETRQYVALQRLWGLKEAFCKGTGDGLSFRFRRAEFEVDADNPRNISLKVDGQPCTGWHFTLQEVMEGHIMATAVTLNPQEPTPADNCLKLWSVSELVQNIWGSI